MKNNLFRCAISFILTSLFIVSLFSCSENHQHEENENDTPVEVTNPEKDKTNETEEVPVEEFKINDLFGGLDPFFTVTDGKVINIRDSDIISCEEYNASLITNAVSIECSRFVYCEDGSIIDIRNIENTIKLLMGKSELRNKYIRNETSTQLIQNINAEHEIKDIKLIDGYYYVYIFDYVYKFKSDIAIDYEEYSDPHFDSNGDFYYMINSDVVKLRNIAYYVEGKTAESEEFILALDYDGNVYSYGTDFNLENIVKIDVLHTENFDIPVALTADGVLVFGEYDSSEITHTAVIKEAETFTDIEDFTYIYTNGTLDSLIILVEKSDGSLWATENSFYDPRYVNHKRLDESLNETTTYTASRLNCYYTVADGKVVSLRKNWWIPDSIQNHLDSINNATDIFEDKYILCVDSSVKLLDPEKQNEYSEVMNFLNTIAKTEKITNITESNENITVETESGNTYHRGEDNGENKKGIVFHSNDSTRDLKLSYLYTDGSVESERFPEANEWTDIVKIVGGWDFLVGLKPDGSTVSAGMDFQFENITQIDVITWEQDILTLLTKEGEFIFCNIAENVKKVLPENVFEPSREQGAFIEPTIRETLEEADKWTDIKDFFWVDTGCGYAIIAAITYDGKLIATTNDIYAPQYVNQKATYTK